MTNKTTTLSILEEIIMNKIYFIKRQKVMLDSDLAELCQVETKQLKEAVKRNLTRFPKDFMFQLNEKETTILRIRVPSHPNYKSTVLYPK